MTEELANHAARLTLPPDEAIQAASDIMDLLTQDNYDKLPKEVLDAVIAESLEALCMFRSLNPARITRITSNLFYILGYLSLDRKNREAIFSISNDKGIFDHIVNIAYSTMKNEDQGWNVAFHNAAFLIGYLSMDGNAEYSNKLQSDLSSNKEFFSLMFKQAIRSTYQGGVVLVDSMLRFESGEILRETIGEYEVMMLLNGTRVQPGLLAQAIRLKKQWTVHSTLRLIENIILTKEFSRNPDVTVLTSSIRSWLIKHNVFGFLFKSIRMKNASVTKAALQIIDCLIDTRGISDGVAKYITKEMISNHLLALKQHENQYLHYCILSKLCTRGIVTQKILMDTKVFKWICNLISSQSNKEPIKDLMKADMLLEAQSFYCQLLKLIASPSSNELWKEEEEKEASYALGFPLTFIKPIFDPKFASGLMNILVHGDAELQAQTMQVMLAALALSTDQFVPILYTAVDKIKGVNVATALFNAVNNAMRDDKPNVSLIYSAIDLLGKLFNDEALKETLIALAKTNTTHAPLNILSCPGDNSSTIFFVHSDIIQASHDLFVLSTENQALCDSIAEYIESNTFHFPLNILFCSTFQGVSNLTKKILLNICNEMLVDEDLKQLWTPFRKQFNNLSLNGENESIADEIECMLEKLWS